MGESCVARRLAVCADAAEREEEERRDEQLAGWLAGEGGAESPAGLGEVSRGVRPATAQPRANGEQHGTARPQGGGHGRGRRASGTRSQLRRVKGQIKVVLVDGDNHAVCEVEDGSEQAALASSQDESGGCGAAPEARNMESGAGLVVVFIGARVTNRVLWIHVV